MKKKLSKKRVVENKVDEYIAKAPKIVQQKLREIRAAIHAAAPGATERTDYFAWPGYSYDDKDYDYDGMFAWFSLKEPHVRLHVRPVAIQNHKKELAAFFTTKAVVGFASDKPIPHTLVKKLVKASIKAMKGMKTKKDKSK